MTNVTISRELLEWNYQNLFKEIYKNKKNKKEVIYHFVTKISGVIDFLSDEEKAGVSQIINEKNAELEIIIQKYGGSVDNSSKNSFEEIFNYNKELQNNLEKTKNQFWSRVRDYYPAGEEGRAII